VILAGDTGGTSTRLGFFQVQAGRVVLVHEERFRSREHPGLAEIVEKLMAARGLQADLACFGIPGPVRDGRAEATNLPWVVDAQELAERLAIGRVWLINDLEANAYGIAALDPKDFFVLNEGAKNAQGNAAVISAGTGLGEAGLFWNGRRHIPFPSEGGHADFAPTDELQAALFRHLMAKYGHVSWERVLSGPGMEELYLFLRHIARVAQPAASLPEEIQGPDRAATITNAGLAGACPVAVETLNTFVSLYGAEAGNLALKVMATGGVFVGGGIAPRIIEKMKGPRFVDAFRAKGRMRRLLEEIPVRIILNDNAALVGAAQCAALRASLLDR